MLKHTLYAAGSVIGGAAAAKVGYDYIPVRERRITYSGDDNELKKFTTSVLTGDVTDHVVLDGRTAIMISKAQETAKYFDLPLESVAVVAGSGHRHNAQMYLENADARKYAIKRMAERFVEVINTGLPHENHALREITHNALFNYLTRTEAYLAKDPGIAKTDKPEEIVDKNVNYFFGFDCDEVMEAIAHLREANVCKDLIF